MFSQGGQCTNIHTCHIHITGPETSADKWALSSARKYKVTLQLLKFFYCLKAIKLILTLFFSPFPRQNVEKDRAGGAVIKQVTAVKSEDNTLFLRDFEPPRLAD